MMLQKKLLFNALPLVVLLNFSPFAFSQKTDSIKVAGTFGGVVTVTTKGISTIPNLTLGKPAVIFDMSVGRRLSFEPQFRFALEGKPWSFVFWWRYELVNTGKLQFKIGGHPAFSFKTVIDTMNGASEESIVTTRYLAGELAPGYWIAKNVRIGIYYLYARGIEKVITRNTHQLAFQGGFSNIKLTNQFYMRINPQIYYLNMDGNDGFYVTTVLTLAKQNFPLTVSSLFNKTIQTDIPAGDDFLWNISLIYTFNKRYVEI
jgi:hypothetical protein